MNNTTREEDRSKQGSFESFPEYTKFRVPPSEFQIFVPSFIALIITLVLGSSGFLLLAFFQSYLTLSYFHFSRAHFVIS